MHEKKALRASIPDFAFDHMQPMQPVVDRPVLHLVDRLTLPGTDFLIQHDGVCRSNPELAPRVAQVAGNHMSATKDRRSANGQEVEQ